MTMRRIQQVIRDRYTSLKRSGKVGHRDKAPFTGGGRYGDRVNAAEVLLMGKVNITVTVGAVEVADLEMRTPKNPASAAPPAPSSISTTFIASPPAPKAATPATPLEFDATSATVPTIKFY